MRIALHTAQREQAGSDSYNRFEYQTHWIVCHIIDQIDINSECIVFCEFHDDMAKITNERANNLEFYQIKTKENTQEWTISELSKKAKKKDGSYKNSFLGFIFYNFMTFGDECLKCHFVSNNNFDSDIRTWQAYIEDDYELKQKDINLYNKIKYRLEAEYGNNAPQNFNDIYDRFIQNTYVYQSDIRLDTFKDQICSRFFSKLANKEIPTSTAGLILQQIINDVRKKSCKKITTPISFKALVDKKGIEVSKISKMLNIEKNNYSGFRDFLYKSKLPSQKILEISALKAYHDTRLLNIENTKYSETILLLNQTIDNYIHNNTKQIDLQNLITLCHLELNNAKLSSCVIDDNLIEVLFYEHEYKKLKPEEL